MPRTSSLNPSLESSVPISKSLKPPMKYCSPSNTADDSPDSDKLSLLDTKNSSTAISNHKSRIVVIIISIN
ncbi:hypothetical protein LguiA_034416 [Lonicera macranthoides]